MRHRQLQSFARRLRRHWLPLSLSSAVAFIGWVKPALWHDWETTASGLSLETRGISPPNESITILAIDDFTLQQAANVDLVRSQQLADLRHWPWPRRVYANLLDKLFNAGARAVAIDILFDAPSTHGQDDDFALAAKLRQYRGQTLLAAMILESKGDSSGLSLQPPIQTLGAAAGIHALGLVNAPAEPDGSMRSRPGDYSQLLRAQLGDAVPPSIAQKLLSAARQKDRTSYPPIGGSWRGLLNMYGPPRTIRTVPLWDVIEEGSFQALLSKGVFKNQLVLIGPSAAVFQDLHRSPFSGSEGMPGIEFHATELANRLDGKTIWQWQPGRSWALLLGAFVLLLWLLAERWERPMLRLAFFGVISFGCLLIGQVLLIVCHLLVNIFGIAVVSILTGLLSTGDATARLQWKRWRLRQALGRYLSPAVAAEIANQPAEADGLLGGRSADVVVLMTDIRGFTSQTKQMSEAGRARELLDQLNSYFTEVVDALHAEGATVDKFIGDATLAVFGAPVHRGDRAEAAAALRAALDIQRRLIELNQRWLTQGLQAWSQVIVLHYGPVISGNVGSPKRMDYTVIGDGVNTASRLESVAKQCGRSLIMSAGFAELLDNPDSLVPLGVFELRGYGEVSVFGLNALEE